MNTNLRRYLKSGIVHFMAYPEVQSGDVPVSDTIGALAEDSFFDVIEVAQIHDAQERKCVRSIIESAHMELCYAAMPMQKMNGRNINDTNEENRQSATEALYRAVDEAADLGAAAFSFKSGIYRKEALEEHYQALVKSTLELCGYIRRTYPMRISLEVFDYDVDTCSLIGPVALAKRYSDEIRKTYPEFGLMVDLSHLPQLRETPEESLLPVKENINHAHIGNCFLADKQNPLYGDKHPRFGYPGSETDVEQLTEYLRVLLEAGYLKEGYPRNLSIEVKPVPGENPKYIIAGAKRTLLQAWERL